MGLGVYRCSKCDKSYTKRGLKALKKTKTDYKCKCGGKAKEIKDVAKYVLELTHPKSDKSVEEFYYQMLDELREREYDPEKVRDVYTASESSDFWASMERRKAAQADQAMKYIASIGSMIKNMFQILRELRMIDERLAHYNGRASNNHEDDIALKGLWIDKVEGGAQKPTSIYGMALQRGFTTLPDLFFELFPKKKDDVGKLVESLERQGINRKVREVLKRKLAEYMTWVENTEKELNMGRRFKLQYLRQHFHVIRMYLDWTRPYLQNVSDLNVLSRYREDKRAWTEIIRAAETAVIDLEVIGVRGVDYYKDCIRMTFHYVTMPTMGFMKDYERGPGHLGKTIIEVEGYVLSDSDIKAYKEKQLEDDVELLKSLFSAMEALEDELLDYLKQAGDEYAIKKLEEREAEGSADKKDSKGLLALFFSSNKNKIPSKFIRKQIYDVVKGKNGKETWDVYDKFKKFYGYLRW